MFHFLIVIVAVGLVVFGLRKGREQVPWGKPLAAGSAGLLLLLALIRLLDGGENASSSLDRLRDQALRMQSVSAEKLGEYLVSEYRGARTVVVSHMDYSFLDLDGHWPYGPPAQHLAIQEEAFLDAVDDDLEILDVVHPELPTEIRTRLQKLNQPPADPDEPDAPLPTGFGSIKKGWQVSVAELDAILAEHAADCELLVILNPVPPRLHKLALWKRPDRPKVAFLNPGSSSISALAQAVAEGLVDVAVCSRQIVFEADTTIPGDLDDAFEMLYLLLTPENVADIREQDGRLLR